ncbi:MAG: VWA domain-containing protein [Spirochaetales bacterium]|nr:VWA domain-containing protein [Spirochaetales bacterium]
MKKLLSVLCILVLGPAVFAVTGDVNNDGTVNIVDALLTAQYSVGLPLSNFDAAAADVNGDGAASIIDSLLIAQYYVGMISSFPADGTPTNPPSTTSVAPATPLPTAVGTSAPATTSLPGVTNPPSATGAPSATLPPGVTSAPVITSAPSSGESGLEAGYADDNEEFNSFLSFLDEYSSVKHYELKIYERIIFHIQDINGESLSNAGIEVFNELEELICEGTSYADGTFMFFPAEYGDDENYIVKVTFRFQTKEMNVERDGVRNIDVVFDFDRPAYDNVPLDMLFVLDTTGSMGEEINQLKTTIELINQHLSTLPSNPLVRFGMVLFRDRDDAQTTYLTQVVPLTDNLDLFQTELSQVTARGGGDKQENLEQALEEAMHEIDWNEDGIRLGWIITDAGPKLYEDETYRYVDAARDAHEAGIKFFSVGAGGLELGGEYVLRQISQYTCGKFIFLTYGETGPSEGGVPGSVSHHTGDDFETDTLESILIHFAEEELSHLTDESEEKEEAYFEAVKIDEETKEETLAKLFDMAVDQLIDYSSLAIEEGTVIPCLPVVGVHGEYGVEEEYFTGLLEGSLDEKDTVTMIEDDLETILDSLDLEMTDYAEDLDAVAEVGEYLETEVMICSQLQSVEDHYEMVMGLFRVETAEMLGRVLLKIDPELGPAY